MAYLEDYCTEFNLWPYIKLNTKVVSVTRSGLQNHRVTYEDNDQRLTLDCDAIAVCSGLHVEPNIPSIEGIQHVPRVIHSSDFKARKQFCGSRTIMVVGCGETGADISYLAVTYPQAERVIVCHRDGFHFAPKVNFTLAIRALQTFGRLIPPQRNPGPVILPILGRKPDPKEPGIPIDVSRANLFDTAYVHQMLRRNDALLWEYYNLYIKSLLWISSGTTFGMDQWVGEISPARHDPSKSKPKSFSKHAKKIFL